MFGLGRLGQHYGKSKWPSLRPIPVRSSVLLEHIPRPMGGLSLRPLTLPLCRHLSKRVPPAVTRKRTIQKHILSNLDPTKIQGSDIIDLSGAKMKMIRVATSDSGSIEDVGVSYNGKTGAVGAGSYLPFPPHTKGVFYFTSRPNKHFLAGDVRFRLLPEDRKHVDLVELFTRGQDLMYPSGTEPWRIHWLPILGGSNPALRRLLLRKGYIDSDSESQFLRFISSSPPTPHTTKSRVRAGGGRLNVLEDITDPFVLDFSKSFTTVHILHKEYLCTYPFPTFAFTTSGSHGNTYGKDRPNCYYSGKASVRFELIQTPKGSRLVIRVLKFIKPPNPGSLVFQKEGELLKKYHPVGRLETIWMARGDLLTSKFMTPSSVKLLEKTYIPC